MKRPMIRVVVLLLLTVGNDDAAAAKQHNVCKHNYPKTQDLPHPVHVERTRRNPKHAAAADHRMRIKVFFHESVDRLGKEQRHIIKDVVVPEGTEFWERSLKVRRRKGDKETVIRLNRMCKNNRYFVVDNNDRRGGNDVNNTQYCMDECLPTKCGEFPVPENHLEACSTCNSEGYDCGQRTRRGSGVRDVDFVLYITALDTVQCASQIGGEASTVAYAAHCQQEADLDRPVAGHTNICPKAIVNEAKKVTQLTSTVKHELLHALGFSLSLYAFYRDEEGAPLTPRGPDGKPPINHQLRVRQWSSKTIQQFHRQDWKVRSGSINRTVTMVVTPRVKEEVRRHFNCSTLEGAELEDQGGDGTALTHWEKRVFQNEAMTGTVHTEDPYYSRLTFALLEDTGWYLPNYDMAQEMTWGRHRGCDFATKSCRELMSNDDQASEFCSMSAADVETKKTLCTHDRSAVGSCNLVRYDYKIPPIYQNFDRLDGVAEEDVDKYGGGVALADFCPYVQEFDWKFTDGNSSTRGTRCGNAANQPADLTANYALETYAQRARCFEQGSSWSQTSCTVVKTWRRYGAGCYDYECGDGVLKINISTDNRTEQLTCDHAGQNISIALLAETNYLHQGSLLCPSCSDICGAEQCKNKSELNKNPKIGQKAAVKDSLLCGSIDGSSSNVSNSITNNFLRSFLKVFGLSGG